MELDLTNKISLINKVVLECMGTSSLEAIVKSFTDIGVKIMGADYGYAFLWVENEQMFKLFYQDANTPFISQTPRKNGVTSQAFFSHEPLYIDSISVDENIRDDARGHMQGVVVIPMFFQEINYGVLDLCFFEKHIFSEEEKKLCSYIGNAIAQAITINRLVKKEQAARLAAERQEARFRALIENSHDVIILINSTGEILYASPSAERIYGYRLEEMIGRNQGEFINSEDLPAVQSAMERILAGPQTAQTIEFRYRHKNGSWRWLESTSMNMLGDPAVSSIVANVRDITERKEYEVSMLHQALHDPLTGLPNRQEMSARLDLALEITKRQNHFMALLFLDLDHFKKINDGLGHNSGDMLLKVVAHRFLSCVRSEDTVARLGGDEFVIILSEIRSSNDAVLVADKILKAVSIPVQILEHNIHATASIGIAVYPQDGQDKDSLKKSADVALYRAKEAGRNRFRLYDSSMQMYAREKLALENELRQALDLDQIELYYQPVISLKNKRLVAIEALARWHHPTKGLVLPGDFIPLAEETGLILPLGEYMLKAACIQNEIWQKMNLPKFRIAVNLSARQFSESTFISHLTALLAEYNTEPSMLELEITESLAMNDLELTNFNLKLLKKMGIHVTIDDFGTGYSSLNYLKNFPISNLKIDKSFIRHSITSGQDSGIVRTIISMAHNLNLKVIAEGVETKQQLDLLANLGCNYAQGFFIHKPMPAAELVAWVRKEKAIKVASVI